MTDLEHKERLCMEAEAMEDALNGVLRDVLRPTYKEHDRGGIPCHCSGCAWARHITGLLVKTGRLA